MTSLHKDVRGTVYSLLDPISRMYLLHAYEIASFPNYTPEIAILANHTHAISELIEDDPRDVLRTAYKLGKRKVIDKIDHQCDSELADIAARNGHFTLIMSLERTPTCIRQMISFNYEILPYRLEITELEWFISHGVRWSKYNLVCSAARTANKQLFDYLIDDTFIFEKSMYLLPHACYGGNIEIIDALLEKGCKWTSACQMNVLKSNNAELVKYVIARNLPLWIDEDIINELHECGCDNIIKLLQ